MSDMQMQLERSFSASGEGGKVVKAAFKGLMQVFSVGKEGDASPWPRRQRPLVGIVGQG